MSRDRILDELSEEIMACFEDSNQATLANLRLFLTELFIEKVYEKVKASSFSPIKELSDNQKAAFMKIMPVISQTEDHFVASLQIKPTNTSIKSLCDFIESGFSFFKSIGHAYIDPRLRSCRGQTIFPSN